MDEIIWNEVQSTNIKKVAYHDHSLFVTFQTGAVYEYPDVSEEIFSALLNADSVGSFFAKNIKPNYNFVRH